MNKVAEPDTETTGKHRRTEQGALLPTRQYEALLIQLHHHNPGKRSGLCLCCGEFWPCTDLTRWMPWWRDRGYASAEAIADLDDATNGGDANATNRND